MKALIQKGKIIKLNNNGNNNVPDLNYDILENEIKAIDLRQNNIANDQNTTDNQKVKNVIIIPGQLIEYENPQSDSTPHPSGDMYTKTVPWSVYR